MPTGFHEILIYDMGQEEWPHVPLSEIGCLRLDWPKDLFAFVGRYQLELEHMRKECRDRFGGSPSGTCPTCDKYIQVNLGKHVALYHLDLAQLWRCPVDWCPVWKGRSIVFSSEEDVPLSYVPLLYKPPPPSDLPEWSDSEVMPLIIIENNSGVANPRTTDGLLPVGSDILLPQSPEVTSLEDQGVLSAPLSPNRVREGHSQDMPAEGSIFDVSPDVPGFNMRPAGGGGGGVQPIETTQPSPSNYVGFNNPFFGAPIAFAQCPNTSGMDTTTTVPIYNIPKDSSIGIDQSAVLTVFASGVSPDSIPWSTAEDIIRDIVREGPFDVGASPMETEDSPLINTSMPGCPYRMISYTGTAMVDADTMYGLQLHHPRFLEFIGAPESARLLNHSPSFWVDRLGQESAMAAAVNLQRDAGFMISNLQILAQFVIGCQRKC